MIDEDAVVERNRVLLLGQAGDTKRRWLTPAPR